ncbi:Lanthionine synthetase C-like protein [Clostridium cavendishii DSM 21758]|uniref:Lanthionine synthetase C-like protein n=1 Tax=Clostridium cavendishii DSM 21758 TaxID=1121302 RepID=A0A1M6H2P9_9CLOT|nr:lanthionine synthetase C family protein [Clostridium cavendishii]SHJ16467.1 Lanthionine synthetase C-like protein [Clostridium cavendishii DSM 21758]
MRNNIDINFHCEENLIFKNNNKKIIEAISKIIKVIKNPDNLDDITKEVIENQYSSMHIYSNVCVVLAECFEIIKDKKLLDEIHYNYMVKIREELYSTSSLNSSLFSGIVGVGFGVYFLYEKTLNYKKFIDSLNELIVELVQNEIENNISTLENVKVTDYDTIVGLAGVTGYLLLFKNEDYIRICIEKILKYIVKLSDDIEVHGHKVPGWYVSSENQILDADKKYYKRGNFNLGLAHGITGPLTILALALKEGIEVSGQKESISKILYDLKRFRYRDENGDTYWPGILSFEEYIDGEVRQKKTNRASWCYGTPGIARAMYISSSVVGDEEGMEISINAIECLCKMNEKEWGFNSPTFCHGYAGLLAVVQAMYMDTGNIKFDVGREKILEKLLGFFDEESLLGFYDIDLKDAINGNLELVKRNSMGLLDGVVGIALILLSFIKPIKTNWMRIFMIN